MTFEDRNLILNKMRLYCTLFLTIVLHFEKKQIDIIGPFCTQTGPKFGK